MTQYSKKTSPKLMSEAEKRAEYYKKKCFLCASLAQNYKEPLFCERFEMYLTDIDNKTLENCIPV